MSLSLAKVEELAPDQGSLAAAKKLLKPSTWPTLAQDGSGLLWGECQGSGATPYRIAVTEADAGYKCSCPSRKFPCKHSLALMWMRVEGKVDFSTGTPPDWVNDWLSRRRGPSTIAPATGAERPKASIAAVEETEIAVDPKSEARAVAARERNRLEREAAIANGLDELDVWLADQMDAGLAAFPSKAIAMCKVMAQRLFDAKAPGLAARVDTIPARLFALAEAARPTAVVQELGMLHLMAQAYRRQALLAEPLRHDIRQMIGWTIAREALLADERAERVASTWRVWATRSEVQPDKLRRIETWLHGSDRHAVLIEYVPVSTGSSSSGYSVGDTFDAELVFYPSSVPLRALIVRQITGSDASDAPLALPTHDLDVAYGLYEEALIEKPWLGDHPIMFRGARLKRSGQAVYLSGNQVNLPLAKSQSATSWPLLQFEAIDGIGLWDGSELTLCWAQTALGRWVA
ncbi:SWIM zinc finger family protein [Rhizobium rhizogenes]|uniref:SWIM zinc finger family protein n=1 Tax=Rhizobium rhizogenes TaxID=359 RepID=UPI0015748222|nr:SWIM zinc finger family protein [Rhizobium rhizogenes]NTF44341.1 SWIM zinc finger family protein [Rhizobium rhizogenes]